MAVINDCTEALVISYTSCWDSLIPINWKCSKLRSVIKYKICSTKEVWDEELDHIEREFIEINGYPKWITNHWRIECKLVNEPNYQNIPTNIYGNILATTTHIYGLTYKDKKEKKLIESLKRHVKKFLSEDHLSQLRK